jgi:hypothetical protein
MPIPATHTIAQDQKRAMGQAQALANQENHGATTLVTQDRMSEPDYFIYVYNILDKEWVVRQPPLFAAFHIPKREKGKKFSYTLLPAFVNEVTMKAGTTELSYKQIDGRKAATSLLNPGAFPGIAWEGQLNDWGTEDQTGNNLNNFGCFWSMTRPDELDKLEVEIELFAERCKNTMEELVKRAEELFESGERKLISPMMHYAMDYLGKQAPWHMSMRHMVTCPICGDSVPEGIAYHKNSFGDRCIIDMAKYEKFVLQNRPAQQIATEEDPDVKLEQVIARNNAKPKKAAKGKAKT